MSVKGTYTGQKINLGTFVSGLLSGAVDNIGEEAPQNLCTPGDSLGRERNQGSEMRNGFPRLSWFSPAKLRVALCYRKLSFHKCSVSIIKFVRITDVGGWGS